MNGLIPFVILLLFGIVIYLFYDAGIFDDIIKWFKTQWDSLEIPELDLLGRKAKAREEEFQRAREAERQRMMEEMRNEVKAKKSSPKPASTDNRKSRVGQRITEWELGYLWEGIVKRKRVPCFNCLNADMYTGNQTSSSALWYCPNCGQGINLSITSGNKEGVICDNIGIDKTKIQ
jgi:hypothetical protein